MDDNLDNVRVMIMKLYVKLYGESENKRLFIKKGRVLTNNIFKLIEGI